MSETDKQGAEKNPPVESGTAESPVAPAAGKGKKGQDLQVRFTLTAAAEEVATEIQAVAGKYQKEVKISGFRKGAVPLELVIQRYQDVIRDEALQQVINRKLYEKIDREKIQVASQPIVEDLSYEDGSDLKAEVLVERLPDVPIPDLEKLVARVDSKELKVEPFNEQQQIEKVLENHKYREPVRGRPIETGDILQLKVQSKFMDTKRKTPMKEETVTLDNKKETDIMNLSEELLGKNRGEQLVFQRRYPSDYKRKAWAGKEMEHSVEIKEAHFLKKPDFNQQFVKSLGFENEQQFKEQLKKEYDEHSKKEGEDRVVAKIIETLTDAADFDVPESLVEQEIKRLNPYGDAILQQLDEKKRKEFVENLRKNAVNNVKFSLLYDAIQKTHSLSVSQEDLEKEYRKMVSEHNVSLAEVRKYYAQSEQRQKLQEALERNRVIEFLKEKITVKEV